MVAGDVNDHFADHFPCNYALTPLAIEGLVVLNLTRYEEGRREKEERKSILAHVSVKC